MDYDGTEYHYMRSPEHAAEVARLKAEREAREPKPPAPFQGDPNDLSWLDALLEQPS